MTCRALKICRKSCTTTTSITAVRRGSFPHRMRAEYQGDRYYSAVDKRRNMATRQNQTVRVPVANFDVGPMRQFWQRPRSDQIAMPIIHRSWQLQLIPDRYRLKGTFDAVTVQPEYS